MDGKTLEALLIEDQDDVALKRDRVTYKVILNKTDHGDKRGAQRRRTRLRSGKVLTCTNRFLVECLIYDVSQGGARLRVSGAQAIPNRLRLYRDEERTLTEAEVVWRGPDWVGIEFDLSASAVLKPAERASLEGKYYGMDSPRW